MLIRESMAGIAEDPVELGDHRWWGTQSARWCGLLQQKPSTTQAQGRGKGEKAHPRLGFCQVLQQRGFTL